METPVDDIPPLTEASKQAVQQALGICANRVELLFVEVQEERERIMRAVSMAVGITVFTSLAGVAITVLVAVAFWWSHPIIALASLTALYVAAGAFLLARLARMQREWQTFPDTLEQLRKDRECLKKALS